MANRGNFGLDQKSINELIFWWHNGLKLFFKLCAWLSIPVVTALFLGKWLDEKYQTRPRLFFICLAIAFFITIGAIYNETRNYLSIKDKQEKEKND